MKFVLDKKKWICGLPNRADKIEGNYLGSGDTKLENAEGFRCCLGQFLKQINPNFEILGKEMPYQLNQAIEPFSKYGGLGSEIKFDNTRLTEDLACVNDNARITVEEKIKRIRLGLEREGHELEVVG